VAIVFAGFKNDLITIGGEVSYKSNIDCNRGHHVWGVSSTGGINLTEKLELFGRYDYISSVTIGNEIMPWNYRNDGNFAVIGMQYIVSPFAKIALNYQGRSPYSPLQMETDMIYLNLLFKF